MTSNQVAYWSNVEKERANKQSEQLKAQELAHKRDELEFEKNKAIQDRILKRAELEGKYGPSYSRMGLDGDHNETSKYRDPTGWSGYDIINSAREGSQWFGEIGKGMGELLKGVGKLF